MEEITTVRNRLEQYKGKRQQLEQMIEEVSSELKARKRLLDRYERALEIVKVVGLQTQKQLEYHLAEQVSLALAAVFDYPYEFKVRFQEKRGKTEAELLLVRDGMEIHSMKFVGGGVRDVASLGLRVAYWAIRQDRKTRPVFLLDEPFAHLKGEEANYRALALLREMSQKLGIQILMVSDERVPREVISDTADRVFVVEMRKGVSRVREGGRR